MKHLATILAVFLLMGCQTTNAVPPKDTSPTKEQLKPKAEVVPTQKPQKKVVPPKEKPVVPTVVSTMKPLMCGDPTTTLEAITEKAKEMPLAMWQDVQTGYNVILLYNKEQRSATLLEYIPGPYACFLSIGKDVHVEGVDFPPKKTGISVERSLTKPLKDGINIVQFNDMD